MAFVNTRLRRHALFAGQTSVARRWAGDRVRVSATVHNPNGSAVNLSIIPMYQLATGGMQNTRAWSSGTRDGSPVAAHGTVHWTFTGPPEGGNHPGEPIAVRAVRSDRHGQSRRRLMSAGRKRGCRPGLAAVLEAGHLAAYGQRKASSRR